MIRTFVFLSLLLSLPLAHAEELDYKTLPLPELTQMATEGDVRAQTNLGLRHAAGEGVPQDFQEAVSWFGKAAEQGYATAQFGLGSMYDNGEGVSRDLGQAANWYRKAAEQGFLPALFNLGLMYENGEGVPQDIVLAYTFFSIAASGGSKDAVVARDIVAARMAPAHIGEGKAIISKWQPGNPLPTVSKTGRMGSK